MTYNRLLLWHLQNVVDHQSILAIDYDFDFF